MSGSEHNDVYLLGGHDLEMVEIRRLLEKSGLADRVFDAGLKWGATASAYLSQIRTTLAHRDVPVLVELPDDLPRHIDRRRIVFIDHHGDRAGRHRPSALRQVFLRLRRPKQEWTRRLDLVETNDIGHIPAMRRKGATPVEIRAIRDEDRRAQGVTRSTEARSRKAVAARRSLGPLTVIKTAARTSSAIADFLSAEYGGPDLGDYLVLMPGQATFFGDGRVISALKDWPGSWYGGELPKRGYWGAPVDDSDSRDRLATEIASILARRKVMAPRPAVAHKRKAS